MGVISISRRRFLFGCGLRLGQSGRLLGAVIIIALTFTGSFERGKEKKGKEWGMGSFWGESDDSILVEGGGQGFFFSPTKPHVVDIIPAATTQKYMAAPSCCPYPLHAFLTQIRRSRLLLLSPFFFLLLPIPFHHPCCANPSRVTHSFPFFPSLFLACQRPICRFFEHPQKSRSL